MGQDNLTTSRRAFVFRSGATVGGIAAGTAALAGPAHTAPHSSDLEAIHQLQLGYTTSMESQSYATTAALFTPNARLSLGNESAEGHAAIQVLLLQRYAQQTASSLHAAYRPNATRGQDTLSIHDDGTRAAATWHVDVRVTSPLQGDCTAAQMARLQGMAGDVHWESGVLEAGYQRIGERWMIASLAYRAA